jgi:uncharacterized membrane protein
MIMMMMMMAMIIIIIIIIITLVTREHVTLRSTAEFRKVTSSLVTQVKKVIQADGGHFEQLV